MRIIIVAIVVAGCGRDPSTSSKAALASGSPAADSKKPCEYMARADAETAAGLALPQTNESKPPMVSSCAYLSPDFFSVDVIVREWDGFKDGMKLDGAKHPLIAVAGLGDEAWGANATIEYTRLYVRKGDRGLVLTLNSPAIRALDDKGLARAKVLALTILPRI
jgi:hypothetical protein